MKRIGLGIGVTLLALVAVLALRTATLRSAQIEVQPAPPVDVEAWAVAQRLGLVLRLETVSPQDPADFDPRPFRRLHNQLRRMYPNAHQALEREVVGSWSLLYTWKGRDASLPPIVLTGHLDVVPVDPDSLGEWTHPPFGGVVQDGVAWGRGALDDKASVIALLDAVERLVRKRFVPERTVYLAFGHDEELGGMEGARAIALLLDERNVKPAFVLDEGSVVATGHLPGLVDAPVALVGIAEKGSASIQLELGATGGHSATPERRTAIGDLARAVVRLEDHPMPAGIDGVTGVFLDHLAPELAWLPRAVLANRWLFGPLLSWYFSRVPPLDAMQRTTTAAAIFQAGLKENALPTRATAVINFRIHPRDNINAVSKHVRDTLADDRIQVSVGVRSPPRNPSPIAPVDSDAYRELARAIRASFPEAKVVPFLVLGGTDARHYYRLTDAVYRFLPLVLGPEALTMSHGVDEHISAGNLADAVRFYIHLLETAAGPAAESS